MNEITPPSGPEQPPPPPPGQPTSVGPGKGACAGLGVALFFISCIGGIALHFLPLLGLGAAITSLFFEGYRYIFVGYILTALILAGLAFLLLILFCGNMNMH